jgi:hypothetical protein
VGVVRRITLLLPLTALLVGACAGAEDGSTARPPSASSASTGDSSAGASASVPAGAVELTRSGGLAGVHDTLLVRPDGTATVTGRDGRSRPCQVDESALVALRAVDPGSLGSAAESSGPRIADGFTYALRTQTGSVTVTEGQTGGRRPELLEAAAAVFAGCSVSPS